MFQPNSRVPEGFTLTGVHCGIKSDPRAEDLTLIVADSPAVAAGVYTQNAICAAPVILDRSRTPSDRIRTIVINSANANACTGVQGERDAHQMAQWAADSCAAESSQALVLSTGIIGERLPMGRIQTGIQDAARRLGAQTDHLLRAARGMMTTDTVPKYHAGTTSCEDSSFQITGIAKGAAMIGPQMATMLAVVLTDARLDAATAQTELGQAVDITFNCISVEGHVSTNDSVLLLASGAKMSQPMAGEQIKTFREGLTTVCEELAKAIPGDGEGVNHRITIEVRGCASREHAHRIAKTVANSPLVKTAIAGADPNWGRIVSAVGYAGVPVNPGNLRLHINGNLLFERGEPVAFDAAAVSRSIAGVRETRIELELEDGDSCTRFWTTDLTTEYVRLNTEHT